MNVNIGRIAWFLGLMKLCVEGAIQHAPLKDRLCAADYVFKFRVTSNAKMYCWKLHISNKVTPRPQSPIPSDAPSLSTSPETPSKFKNPFTLSHSTFTAKENRPSANSSSTLQATVRLTNNSAPNHTPSQHPRQVPTTNDVSPNATSSGRVNTNVTTSDPSSSGRVNAPGSRNAGKSARSRHYSCYPIARQDVEIMNNQVYKGADGLKKMREVKVIDGKDYYESCVKIDLNSDKLKFNETYLFVGKKIKNHFFISNLNNVELWNKVEDKLTKFNFDTECKSTI